jgi:hypothetical protein
MMTATLCLCPHHAPTVLVMMVLVLVLAMVLGLQ